MGWQDEAKEAWQKQTEGDLFKVKPDSSVTLRILQNKKGKDKAPFYTYRVHRNVGPKKKMVRCGYNLTGDGSCWLCDEMLPKYAESSKKEKQAIAKDLSPREQMIMQVATYDDRTEKFKGPFMFYVPTGRKTLSTMFLGLLGNAKKKSFDDPVKGHNITVTRAGQGLETTYAPLDVAEDPTEVPKKILDQCKPFLELAPKYSEEKQKAAFYGRDEEEVEPAEDEEDKPKSKKKPAADDEDEPNDEPNEKPKGKKKPVEEDEDEEEEKPKGKKKPAKEEDEDEDTKPPFDEEEEEDTPSTDDEDEEDKPKGKKKPVDDEDEDDPEPEEGEDEEVVDDEDEDEPKPAKKTKKEEVKKAKKKVVQDEDED